MEILTEKGVISRINGKKITIEIPKKPECEECRSIFCTKSEGKTNSIVIESSDDFYIGENVEIQLAGKYLTKATLFLFVFPLIILVITITITIKSGLNNLYSALIGFLFVAIYFLIIRYINDIKIKPNIVKKQ